MARLGIKTTKRALHLMDQDGDGQIDYREFLDIAVTGWEDDSDEAMIRLTDKVALRQIFVRFGEFNVGTVRRRSAAASERPKFDAEGTPYGDTLENGRLDTSWALVTMGSESAANDAVVASPLEVAPGISVQISPYDAQAAARSRGGMQQVLARHQWEDTGRIVLVPLEWVRTRADANGFALWHYFLELCVGHFCLLIMGGRLARFAELSCNLEAPWDPDASIWEATTAVDRQGQKKGYNWYIIFGAMLGKGGGFVSVLYLFYNDCRNKLKAHIPDHMRNPSGIVQVPCWSRIVLMYTCALLLVEIFSPRPHLVDWLYGDAWRNAVDEDENRDLVGWGVLAATCFFLYVVSNSSLWEMMEETRTGIFPKQSLMIDGCVGRSRTQSLKMTLRLTWCVCAVRCSRKTRLWNCKGKQPTKRESGRPASGCGLSPASDLPAWDLPPFISPVMRLGLRYRVHFPAMQFGFVLGRPCRGHRTHSTRPLIQTASGSVDSTLSAQAEAHPSFDHASHPSVPTPRQNPKWAVVQS